MRILIIGATGYVSSRTIPLLLSAGHTVIAAARRPEELDAFWWGDRVERSELDANGPDTAVPAIAAAEADALIYLVHGLGGRNFSVADRTSARQVRRAADAAGIGRIVYLSGIIPAVAPCALSQHLASRLEVEEELSRAAAVVITLRAAMIIGAGSTSLALMMQLVERLPVLLVPRWARSLVEPIAIIDVAAAIAAALHIKQPTGQVSIGSGTVMTYPQLVDLLASLTGRSRRHLPAGPLPQRFVAKAATLLSSLPRTTVAALIESLQTDMVTAGDTWRSDLFPGESAYQPLSPRIALQRALRGPDLSVPPAERDPQAALPGDRW